MNPEPPGFRKGRHHNKGNNSIPDRWTDYTPIGSVIAGTRFVTFKVPLNEKFHSRLAKDQWFTPQMLINHMTDSNQSLGLVIDLTFTTRYYQPEEFTSHDVLHQKILVPGHEIPTINIIKTFYKAVDAFLESSPDHLIGVHCTHGVNRTGYIVCRYMVERLGMKPEDALEAYKTARGYPVERENYVADLMTRSRIEDYDPDSGEEKEIKEAVDHQRKTNANFTKEPETFNNQSDNYERRNNQSGNYERRQYNNYRHDSYPGFQDSRQHPYRNGSSTVQPPWEGQGHYNDGYYGNRYHGYRQQTTRNDSQPYQGDQAGRHYGWGSDNKSGPWYDAPFERSQSQGHYSQGHNRIRRPRPY